jgi:hypothetical protein
MHRKGTTFSLTLLAMAALGAGGGLRTILVDDFDDGVSDGWEETDFTSGRGSFDASSGSYVLSTTEAIPVDDPSVGALDADWEASEDDPGFANGTVRGTIRADTHGTTVGFLLRDSHETESDYGFYGSASFGTFYIEHFNLTANPAAPQTILAMADPEDFPFEVGETYHLEASAVGHRLTLRAWKVGDPRPARPILSVTDRRLPPGAGSGIASIVFFDPVPLMEAGVTEVEVSGTVDDITFTPGIVH